MDAVTKTRFEEFTDDLREYLLKEEGKLRGIGTMKMLNRLFSEAEVLTMLQPERIRDSIIKIAAYVYMIGRNYEGEGAFDNVPGEDSDEPD